MAALSDVMAYLISHYPENMRHELSNARLTKMVYLCDWHHAINFGKQLTDIKWHFDNFGPFVRDIEREANARQDLFVVLNTVNMHGQPKKQFALRSQPPRSNLSQKEIESLKHIIDVTKKLYWDDFIKLVYSTHPVASSPRHTHLDLISKAAEYRLILDAKAEAAGG